MPYNNTPIAPPREYNGTVSLPLARVKKIIHADDDIGNCSNNAAFVIAVATEMFVQHLTEQIYNVVKSERRPRRTVAYRDVASAISRLDNLEFLTDVVPRTVTYRQFKDRKAAKEANAQSAGNGEQPQLMNGQRTLHQMASREKPQNGYDGADETDEDGDVEMGEDEQEQDHNQDHEQDHKQPLAQYLQEPIEEGKWENPEDELDHTDMTPKSYRKEYGREMPMQGSPTQRSGERIQPPRARHPPARHAYDAVRDRFED